VEYASEFRYRNPVIAKGDVIIAISQSGETADTLVAIETAKKQSYHFRRSKRGRIIYCRVSDAGAYTHAGPEIGVASTKAFTAQLAVLTMIALKIAHQKAHLTATLHAPAAGAACHPG
jgi:glucosamine--fructose-6-phosphate aminotransferase (isomerizing)